MRRLRTVRAMCGDDARQAGRELFRARHVQELVRGVGYGSVHCDFFASDSAAYAAILEDGSGKGWWQALERSSHHLTAIDGDGPAARAGNLGVSPCAWK